MRGTKDSYYWDTCLFVSWLADEKRPSGDMDGVREIVAKVKKRDGSIVTSALTLAEVLPSKCPAGVFNLFEDLLKRTTFRVISVDRKIAKLAGDLRVHYEKDGKKLKTPDSIHLATAIINGVSEFHTFDAGILSLNGNVAGHKLIICKPSFKQPSLDLVVNNDKISKAKKSGA